MENKNDLHSFMAVNAREVPETGKLSLAKDTAQTVSAAVTDTSDQKELKDNNEPAVKDDSETADKADWAAENENEVQSEAVVLDKNAEQTEEKDIAPETDTQAQNDEEEIIFAGSSDVKPVKTAFSAKQQEMPDTADDSEDVVFAEAVKNPPKSRIKVQREKKKFPVGIVAAVASVAVVAAAGGLIAWTISKNSVETATETTSDSKDSPEISVVSRTSDDAVDFSDVSEEPLDIENVDPTNILFGENVTVEGVNLAGKSLTQAYDAMQERLLEIREPISISVVCDGKSLTLTQNDFVFDTDISSVLVQAYHYSRGELDDPTVESSFDGKVTDFKVQSAINTESVEAAINKTAEFYDIQPVDAHVTKFDPTAAQKFEYADGSDGFLVDHDELSEKIKTILSAGEKTGSVSISTHQTPFKVSMADIKANTRLIASHSTTASNVYNSVYNMELAIKAANGCVVMPGEKFSFNDTTGDTTNGNEHTYPNGTTGAYLPSTAYSQGKVVQEYGGGICQASTTMFLCAVKANMEITDRYAHMYASSYAPYGLDATVDYGNLDMSFINPTDYPVYIATYVYDYNGDGLDELCVEMYGPLSEEYDEIVPIGWVTYAGEKSFSARGAKVFFKNGQEVRRENLPSGSYDYHYESYSSVVGYMPDDISYGPSASATWSAPTIYSPNGCGDNGPVAYGTAADVLKKARSSSSAQTPQASR